MSTTTSTTSVDGLLDPDSFFEQYVRVGRPVLMEGLLDTWPARDRWSRRSLKERYGHREVALSRSGDSVVSENQDPGWFSALLSRYSAAVRRTHSLLGGALGLRWAAAGDATRHATETISLATYVDGLLGSGRREGKAGGGNPHWAGGPPGGRAPYLFKKRKPLGDLLAGDYAHPAMFRRRTDGTFDSPVEERDRNAIFYLGPAGSGTGFHAHSAAWNALLFGRKRWFLLPPEAPVLRDRQGTEDTEADAGGASWSEQLSDAELDKLPLRPLVCDQLPGETFYVPDGWQHAVLNMESSIGVAVEIGSDDPTGQARHRRGR